MKKGGGGPDDVDLLAVRWSYSDLDAGVTLPTRIAAPAIREAYEYRVLAFNDIGTSAFSNIVTVLT
jgi:hypothetical protein